MSLIPRLDDGYYDESGFWQRTKFCFIQCQDCTCQPPDGMFYNEAHDRKLKKDPPPRETQ